MTNTLIETANEANLECDSPHNEEEFTSIYPWSAEYS